MAKPIYVSLEADESIKNFGSKAAIHEERRKCIQEKRMFDYFDSLLTVTMYRRSVWKIKEDPKLF